MRDEADLVRQFTNPSCPQLTVYTPQSFQCMGEKNKDANRKSTCTTSTVEEEITRQIIEIEAKRK